MCMYIVCAVPDLQPRCDVLYDIIFNNARAFGRKSMPVYTAALMMYTVYYIFYDVLFTSLPTQGLSAPVHPTPRGWIGHEMYSRPTSIVGLIIFCNTPAEIILTNNINIMNPRK